MFKNTIFTGNHFKSYSVNIKSRFPAIRLKLSLIAWIYYVPVCTRHVLPGRGHNQKFILTLIQSLVKVLYCTYMQAYVHTHSCISSAVYGSQLLVWCFDSCDADGNHIHGLCYISVFAKPLSCGNASILPLRSVAASDLKMVVAKWERLLISFRMFVHL